MSRTLLGLSIGSAREGVEAAVVRTGGVGLALAPRVERTARVPLPPSILDALRKPTERIELARGIAEAAVQAARIVAVQAGIATRDLFAVGLLEPAQASSESFAWSEVGARIAETTGLTLVQGFRDRDRAAGGTGHPISAVPDFLLFHREREDRLLIHLGAVSSVLLLSGNAKVSAATGFETGPGSQWLDAILFHGTRGKELSDCHGKNAVQGRCVEPLLSRWLEHPYLTRQPPKAVSPEAFGRAFLHAAFDSARTLGASLTDLLCTANHFIARTIGEAWRTGLPPANALLRILVSGGGVRNGFLWQLLGQQFEGTPIARTDEIGIPSASRKPAAAAVLAALACDGVPGNLAPLTGAAGGRILGHIVPGDSRNWARCSAWVAEQSGDAALHRNAA